MKKNIFLLFLLTSFATMFGQVRNIQFRITDSNGGRIQGATVLVNGVTSLTTDADGGALFTSAVGNTVNYTVSPPACTPAAPVITGAPISVVSEATSGYTGSQIQNAQFASGALVSTGTYSISVKTGATVGTATLLPVVPGQTVVLYRPNPYPYQEFAGTQNPATGLWEFTGIPFGKWNYKVQNPCTKTLRVTSALNIQCSNIATTATLSNQNIITTTTAPSLQTNDPTAVVITDCDANFPIKVSGGAGNTIIDGTYYTVNYTVNGVTTTSPPVLSWPTLNPTGQGPLNNNTALQFLPVGTPGASCTVNFLTNTTPGNGCSDIVVNKSVNIVGPPKATVYVTDTSLGWVDPPSAIGGTLTNTDTWEVINMTVPEAYFLNVPVGNYNYVIQLAGCKQDLTGTIEVTCASMNAGADIVYNGVAIPSLTTASVIGSIKSDAMSNVLTFDSAATAVLTTNPGGVQVGTVQSQVQGNFVWTGVTFGDYTMTVTRPCFATASANVTVDCAAAKATLDPYAYPQGASVSVIMPNSASTPSSSVTIFTSQNGFGSAFVTSAELFDFNGSITGTVNDGYVVFENVPYGTYTCALKRNCYVDKEVTNLVVDCAALTAADPQGEVRGFVNYTNADRRTSNDVYIWPLNGFDLVGDATVTLTGPNAYSATSVTAGGWFGSPASFLNVPYPWNGASTYNYTIVAPCFATATGTVSVDCNIPNNGQPISKEVALTSAPCSSTAVLPTSCDVTFNNLNSYIYCGIVRYAQSYRWRVTNLNTFETLSADTPLRQFRVIMLSNFAYNTPYQVEVAVKVGGIWGNYSLPCYFNTGEPTTQMVTCAATPSSMTTQNACNIVQFAKGYRFELTNGEDVTTFDNTVRQFSLGQVTGIMPGTTYDVRVAVQNTDGTYMAYGPTCTITSPGMAAASTTKFAKTSGEVVSSDFSVVSFPNPFANSFAVNVSSISQEKVQIKVYDMVGRLVEQRNANVSELESTQIGNNYQSGIYNVIVSQGENVKTLRVIKR